MCHLSLWCCVCFFSCFKLTQVLWWIKLICTEVNQNDNYSLYKSRKDFKGNLMELFSSHSNETLPGTSTCKINMELPYGSQSLISSRGHPWPSGLICEWSRSTIWKFLCNMTSIGHMNTSPNMDAWISSLLKVPLMTYLLRFTLSKAFSVSN